MDGAGQVLHQGAEIHPALGGEEKEDLVPLEAVLRLYQLHLQAVLRDLLLTDLESPGLLLLIFLPGQLILRGGPAEHRAQGRGELHLIHRRILLGTLSKLHAPGSLDDDTLPQAEALPIGVKIVLPSAFLKADADDLDHNSS